MVIVSFIILLYALALYVLSIGWRKAVVTPDKPGRSTAISFSIIVPFRNEEHNISRTIIDLLKQSHDSFEVIAVDDHSTDESWRQAQKIRADNLRVVKSLGFGKKAAIATGIDVAKGGIIVTTDADSTPPGNWLLLLERKFSDNQTQMVIGPVKIAQSGRLFDDLQAIEFASLIGVSAATCAFNYPTMCNGANLAYRKTVFEEVRGFEGNTHIQSGDDEFLMRKVAAKQPKSIQYLGAAGVVVTQPLKTLRDFFYQRLRWAAKWRFNDSPFTLFVAFCVVTVQASWLTLLFAVVYFPSPLVILTGVLKVLFEYFFLRDVCKWLNVKWSVTAFAVLQFFYAPYVLTVALLSNFVSYQWKGRKIR